MNRRTFIQQSAGAGFTILSANTLFGQATPSKTVRIAIMGCHSAGRGWAIMNALMKLPGVEIATVCDVDSRARDEAAAQVMKIQGKLPKKEVDIRKVLEDKAIDGVVTATPDHWHAPAALMTMKAGKAIYVEKPVSHNPHEGEILVEASKIYKVPFQMGNQRRSSTVYQAAIAEIHKGVIGDARYARCWYTTQRQPIGKGKVAAPPEWLDWDLWQGVAPRREFKDNLVHPRVLGRYVRERRVLTLPVAIAKLTAVPADRLRLADRGRLAVGKAADIVVFDPATIADRATFEKPFQYPVGITLVVVNGRIALHDGQRSRTHAGRALRSAAAGRT